MRAAAQMAGDGARRRDVLLKTETGAVTGLTITGDIRGECLDKSGSGSGSGWATADGGRTLGCSDIEDGEGVE